MLGSWWLLWIVFMLVFTAALAGYGWGFRGWGPPYPSYVQRRRGQRAAAAGSSPGFDHAAWGMGGDLVWIVMCVGLLWALAVLWSR
jgi:hypothetical protein